MLGDITWWEKIVTLFDAIPKVIYFLYTCIASAADAMQLLVRRLCGLDIYYNNQGQIVQKQDPLTEFLNGILGIGDTSGAMQALNTTFWSLTIFALILLALTSIVAIIKSHYNEDVSKTSPAKILYGAFKAILTFFIVPASVIIGLQLSGLLLRTLDGITGGTADSGTISGIYGSTDKFKPYTAGEGEEQYSSYAAYDMFGIGAPATNSPISGQLFRAAAYNCNRFRNGDYSQSDISTMSMGGIFGQGPSYSAATDKLEYVAYQVDYAFMNNLQLSSGYNIDSLEDSANSTDNGARVSLMTFAVGSTYDTFSKYEVSLVWIYYSLWHFNFIVGFAGAISSFGIMISIIIGLMMRLIKSAAMFLIYPPLLGLAPMDDFKAFKSWSNEFIKQILSAFGAIVGLNLLFLILPYVQQISFFNIDLLDAIVNCVFLVTGLIMAKDFISMVAGFVGGGDVFSTGESNKGQVAQQIGKGLKYSVGAGAAVAAPLALPAVFAAKGIKRKIARKMTTSLNTANNSIKNYNEAENEYQEKQKAFDSGEWKKDRAFLDEQMTKDASLKSQYEHQMKSWRSAGKSEEEAKELAYSAVANSFETNHKDAKDQYTAESKNKMDVAKNDMRTNVMAVTNDKDAEHVEKMLQSEDGRSQLLQQNDKSIERWATKNYLNKDGSSSAKGTLTMLGNTIKSAFGPLKIFAKDISGALNIDKLAKQMKTLTYQVQGKNQDGSHAIKPSQYKPDETTTRKALTKQFEKEALEKGYTRGSAEFNKYVNDNLAETLRYNNRQAAKEIGRTVSDAITKTFGGTTLMMGANVAPIGARLEGEKLQQQQLKKTDDSIKAQETTNKKLDELIDLLGKGVVKSPPGP